MKTLMKLLVVLAGLSAILFGAALYLKQETAPHYIRIYGDESQDEAC